MAAYQIKDNSTEYKTLALDVLNLSKQLGDIKLNTQIRSQPHKNHSLLPIWKNVHASYRDVVHKDSSVPDISLWHRVHLVLSSYAYESLAQNLELEGEFLPVEVDGEKRYIFICLSFAKEQEEQCITKYKEGIDMGLEQLFFDDADVESRLLFKSKREGSTRLYCTSHFVDLCRKFDLKGVDFDADLVSVF